MTEKKSPELSHLPLGDALEKALRDHEPTIAQGDMLAVLRATKLVTLLLGELMRIILTLAPDQFEKFYNAAMLRIHQEAHRDMAEKPPDVTGH